MRLFLSSIMLVTLLSACAEETEESASSNAGPGSWSTVVPDAALDTTQDTDLDAGASTPEDIAAGPDGSSVPDGARTEDTTELTDLPTAPEDVSVSEDAAVATDAGPTEDTSDPPPPIEDGGVEINQSWIGGSCEDAGDCWNSDFSQTPSCELSGFPNGFCTQSCAQAGSGSWICPDTQYGPSTGATTSRGITTASGAPTCATECDFDLSPTGCRPGYGCFLRQRHGEPHKIYPICLPNEAQGWPGEPAKGFDIGDACGLDTDCESLMCLQLPGGYCTKSHCQFTGCPSGSTCYGFESGGSACLQDCTSANQCRENEGYTCDSYGSCWPAEGPVVTAWDASVGPEDCATAWAAGLSPCDSFPDDYVVANKSARNLALCQGGEELASFHMGLGFAPMGDKQVEGDGKTPEGVFYVSALVPNSKYYKAFLISYPDIQDAAWGYAEGLISGSEKDAIDAAHAACVTPPQTTALGSYIELHGEGGGQDWTWGCMAIENFELDQVWAALGPSDSIVVKP